MIQFLRFLLGILSFCLRVFLFVVTFVVTFIALALGGRRVTLPKRRATRRRR